MKFKLTDHPNTSSMSSIKASNEFLGILLPLIPLGMIFVLIGVNEFKQWKRQKEAMKKYEKIRPLYNIDYSLKCIGEIAGEPLNEDIQIPNSNTKGVKASSSPHAVKYDLFRTALMTCKKAIDDLLRFYISGTTVNNLQTLVSDLQNKVPVRRNPKGRIDVEFKKDGITFPSDPYYKSLDKVCLEFGKMVLDMDRQIYKLSVQAANAYHKADEETDESKIKEYATFIHCADILAFMAAGVIMDFRDNLRTIEIESVVEDDSDPNTYWSNIEMKK